MENGVAVTVIEVGPRDGLQNLSFFVETENKAALIRKLAGSGIREIQIGSFVNPCAVPQFRDMEDLVSSLGDLRSVTMTCLVPNAAGARAALRAGMRKLVYFFSVSESHNLSNVRQGREESLKGLRSVLAETAGTADAEVTVALATVFGCPFEGYLPKDEVLGWVERVASLGVGEITLCDTVGWGNPRQVEEICSSCRELFPETVFAVHFHDTRGLGLANALKAFEVGIRRFDSALGGLGGCPFAPGASGNIATEDLVFMFDGMGVSTGIRLEALLDVTSYLREIVPGVVVTSALARAGLPRPRGPQARETRASR